MTAPLFPIAILAAGRASRFGGGKLDADCAGKPLGRWVLDAVADAGLPPGLLIVGPEPPGFARDALFEGWSLIANPAPERGLGSSVALAAAHADCLRVDGLLLMLADMPLVGSDLIRTLLKRGPPTRPVAVRHPDGRPGVPARFPSTMLAVLSELDGDRGAAGMLDDREDVDLIDVQAGRLIDVDDLNALRAAEALLRAQIPHDR